MQKHKDDEIHDEPLPDDITDTIKSDDTLDVDDSSNDDDINSKDSDPIEESPNPQKQVEFDNLKIDDTVTDVTPKPHHKPQYEPSKRKTTLLIVSIAAFLIIGGLAAYTFLLKNNPSPEVESKPDTVSVLAEDKLTAKTLVEKAKAVTKGQTKDTLNDTDGNPYKVFAAPSYRPAGYNFSVMSTVDYGYGSYGTKSIISKDLAEVQKLLSDNGLIASVLDSGSDVGQYVATYESKDIICIISDQKPYNEPETSTNYSLMLGCANKSDYLENAATLRQYFIVYSSQSQFDTTKTLMGNLVLKASKTEGYSTATVSISGSEYGSVGGFAGLFYVTPDKVLHYFTGTQSQIPCSEFSTDDLKKAYLGEECYDENNEAAVVKL